MSELSYGSLRKECPICSRPFVSRGRYEEHVNACIGEEQKRLDDEWAKKSKPAATGEE